MSTNVGQYTYEIKSWSKTVFKQQSSNKIADDYAFLQANAWLVTKTSQLYWKIDIEKNYNPDIGKNQT